MAERQLGELAVELINAHLLAQQHDDPDLIKGTLETLAEDGQLGEAVAGLLEVVEMFLAAMTEVGWTPQSLMQTISERYAQSATGGVK